MRNIVLVLIVGASTMTGYRVDAEAPSQAKAAPAAAHILLTPADLKWGPAPALPGAQIAVLGGDPSQAGFFTMRLKFPDGAKIPAHWHPTDENITVLQGLFRAGMGDAFKETDLHDFPTGSFILMPKEVHHFATAKGEVIVQIDGQGPFVINYVNPNDDPTKKKD
jgi:quercetin dioxygenase-like cupin family protein